MDKIDAYIDSWVVDNVDAFKGLDSPNFDEFYKAREIFRERVKGLVRAILETLDGGT